MGYVRKQREECVLFLDDGFSAQSVAEGLKRAGFKVERFPEWFSDEDGHPLRNVPDSDVIRFCGDKGWLLLTRDHEMRNMHRQELMNAGIAVLASAHNSAKTQDEWISALVLLRTRIRREFKNRERPWFAVFSREGRVTSIQTLT